MKTIVISPNTSIDPWVLAIHPPQLTSKVGKPVITSCSNLLLIQDGNLNRIVAGYFIKVEADEITNAHFRAKQGDTYFVDVSGIPLRNPMAYYETIISKPVDIKKHVEEPLPAAPDPDLDKQARAFGYKKKGTNPHNPRK